MNIFDMPFLAAGSLAHQGGGKKRSGPKNFGKSWESVERLEEKAREQQGEGEREEQA
jgi:hypothetical protein